MFERYAIVTQSDVAVAIGKLQSVKNNDTTVTPEADLIVQRAPTVAN